MRHMAVIQVARLTDRREPRESDRIVRADTQPGQRHVGHFLREATASQAI